MRLTCRTIPERSMLDDRYFLPGLRRQHSPAGPPGGSYVSVTLETEQVTAVRDVLCLSHNLNPKSNRSESGVRVATEPLLLYPAYFVAYHPPCATVYCVRSVGT